MYSIQKRTQINLKPNHNQIKISSPLFRGALYVGESSPNKTKTINRRKKEMDFERMKHDLMEVKKMIEEIVKEG